MQMELLELKVLRSFSPGQATSSPFILWALLNGITGAKETKLNTGILFHRFIDETVHPISR